MSLPGQLLAGVARVNITPPLGITLIGYADRLQGCEAVHDDLTATVLLLDDGLTQLVIIALDMLALNEHIVARVRDDIVSHIPSGQVMICCSHTHSGPIAYADVNSEQKNRRFIDDLVEKLVTVVERARADRFPAHLTWGRGEAHIAVNRRQVQPDGTVIIGVNPDGPVDSSLHVLQLHLQNRDTVTLVNFACHPTILGPSNNVVSAEWPGVMRREVEETTGGVCLFLQGATGDLNPNHEWGEDDMGIVEQFGHEVANQVLKTIKQGLETMTAVPLKAVSHTLPLPISPRAKSDGSAIAYQEALSTMMNLPELAVDTILNELYPWKTTLTQQDGRWYTPMEIQVFQIGDCALVGGAAEVFNEIGMAIKNQSPAPITLFAGYSNGCIGYLPTAAAHQLGGYEVEVTPYIYRLPGLLDPDCDTLVVDRSLKMLQALFIDESHG